MGVDLGSRRIGIALTDSAATMAVPWGTLERGDDPERDRRRLVELIRDEGVTTVVVGLPLSLDGTDGPAAIAARQEAEALRELLAASRVGVELFDERLTTVSAHQALSATGMSGRGRRRVVDQAAAAVMLSAWLDTRRPG